MYKRGTKANNQSVSQLSQPALSTSGSSPTPSTRSDKDLESVWKAWTQPLALPPFCIFVTMFVIAISLVIFGANSILIGVDGALGDGKHSKLQEPLGLGIDPARYKPACPDYRHYAVIPQWVLVLSTEFQPC